MGAVNKDLALFFEFLAQEGVTAQFFENWVPNDPITTAVGGWSLVGSTVGLAIIATIISGAWHMSYVVVILRSAWRH